MTILDRLKTMKLGEQMDVKFHELDDMKIPHDDPFGHPNRDEKIEWLLTQLYRASGGASYECMNNVASGHYTFRR